MSEPIVIVDTSSDDEVVVTAVSPSSSGAAGTAVATAGAAKAGGEATGAAASSASSLAAAAAAEEEREQMECPICLQTCIHPARLPCGHIFCFLCVKGVAYKNRRCAMCRREIPVEFLDHPHLLYKIEETAPTTEDGYQWFYEGRNGWWQYDERTSQEIEEAYKRPDKFCTILVAGYVYVVDFETMLQQRQNEPSRKRQVKRDLATIAKKGVAGLRIDGTADPLESSSSGLGATSAASSGHDNPLHSYPYSGQHFYHQHQLQAPSSSAALATSSSSSSSNNTASSGSGAGGGHRHPTLPALVANNLISTIAATDAAIRIASDIIDSTLAHASVDSPHPAAVAAASSAASGSSSGTFDFLQSANSSGSASTSAPNGAGHFDALAPSSLSSSSSSTASCASASSGSAADRSSRQDLLHEVQEALNISTPAANATQAAGSSAAPRLDFFSQTIDEFRSLALSNIAESSSDSELEAEEEEEVEGGMGRERRAEADAGGERRRRSPTQLL